VEFLQEHLHFVMLHWVRCIAMIGVLTVFGTTAAARFAKLAIGIMLGTMLSFSSDPTSFSAPDGTALIVLFITKEMLIGVLFGFATNVIFTIASMAGHFVGEEMGFNMSTIQDPLSGNSMPVMAHIYEALAVATFFASGGHCFLVRCLARSFQVYRVDSLTLDGELVAACVIFASGVFLSALQIAAPVFLALLILGVSLGVLAKVAPDLHVTELAYPIKVAGGLVLVLATLDALVPAMHWLFDELAGFMEEVLVAR
jgi:flagellar biosynthesis protein FliR